MVQKWLARFGYLRWLDAVAGAVVLIVMVKLAIPEGSEREVVFVSMGLFVLAAMLRPVRVRWRPLSGAVGLAVSRSLRPGDRAWFIRYRRADAVLVTARRKLRVSIATADLGAAESMSVRRTRVFVIPDQDAPPRSRR